MYSTCLFCRGDLGRNEALETFPVGRRIAYDSAKGRLWVVCRRCERWNLSPLEIRWEAIEDAERAYRGTPLRVSTDNIGLARLKEGLDLVRIGIPPRIELAGWRYGDQFNRRRRRQALLMVGSVVAGALPLVGVVPVVAALPGLALAGTAAHLAHTAHGLWRMHAQARRPLLKVPCDDGSTAELTHNNLIRHTMEARWDGDGWRLNMPYRTRRSSDGSKLPSSDVHSIPGADGLLHLSGDAALRPLAMLLPHVNNLAGSAKHVGDAVDLIGASPSLDRMLHARLDALNPGSLYPVNAGSLPPAVRLAAEMILHEHDENRALDGEMQALEDRWREAEEIAAIADDLLLPADVGRRLDAMKERGHGGDTG